MASDAPTARADAISLGRFAGQVAVVTGGGSGLGAAISLRLAAEGARVLVLDRDPAGVERTMILAGARGHEALVSHAIVDVTIRSDVDRAIESAAASLGRLDVLVNAAGVFADARFEEMREADWDLVLDINLKGTFLCCQAAARAMIPARYGRIVNFSSQSHKGNFGQANYSASKGGVISMTRTIALELARHGITANAIAPGLIDTPMLAALKETIRDRFARRVPARRIGQPEEVAALVAFLASKEAAYITGTVVDIDGGLGLGVPLAQKAEQCHILLTGRHPLVRLTLMSMSFSTGGRLAGKVAIVTGGGSGIGRATALTFAREGARVLVADLNLPGAEETVRLAAAPGQCVARRLDVSRWPEVSDTVAEVLERWGKLDVLFNCAGVTLYRSIADTTEEDWDRVMGVHLKGTFWGIKAASAPMRAQKSGKIINVSSYAGLQGLPNEIAYCAAKAGIVGLTKAAAKDLSVDGIAVNCIAPVAETPMSAWAVANPDPARSFESGVNAMRRWGKPEEIAAVVLFLASDECSYVTGQTFSVDGGWYLAS